MRVKRIGRICLTLLLLLSLIPTAFAAGTSVVVTAPDTLPAVGESFTVTVSVSKNPGLSAAQVKLGYDDAVLECTAVKNGAVTSGMLSATNTHGTKDGVGAILAAASTDTVQKDGSLAVFTFTVKAAGDAKLSISQTTMADVDGAQIAFTFDLPKLVSEDKTQPSEIAPAAPEDPETPQEAEKTGSFCDVTSRHWAFDSVERAADAGLVAGFSDGTFRPDEPVTRAQFVLMLWRMAGKPEAKAKAPFTDTAGGDWYSQALDWAFENGFVNGLSETAFGPNASITRQQATAILFRYSGGKTGGEAMVSGVYESSFTDSGRIAAWAKDAMWWAVYNSLVSGVGNGKIAPEQNASRAQIAAILLRYMDKFPIERQALA